MIDLKAKLLENIEYWESILKNSSDNKPRKGVYCLVYENTNDANAYDANAYMLLYSEKHIPQMVKYFEYLEKYEKPNKFLPLKFIGDGNITDYSCYTCTNKYTCESIFNPENKKPNCMVNNYKKYIPEK